jgi:hypothetical protein
MQTPSTPRGLHLQTPRDDRDLGNKGIAPDTHLEFRERPSRANGPRRACAPARRTRSALRGRWGRPFLRRAAPCFAVLRRVAPEDVTDHQERDDTRVDDAGDGAGGESVTNGAEGVATDDGNDPDRVDAHQAGLSSLGRIPMRAEK